MLTGTKRTNNPSASMEKHTRGDAGRTLPPVLQRERNNLAVAAGFELPYPDVALVRPTDNGERF
jgi:hypothetical protein